MREYPVRGIRPWLWLVSSVLFVLVGAVMALAGLAALTEPDDIGGVVTCRSDFGDDCLTERAAVVDHEGYVRRGWLSGEQKWVVDVPEGAPGLEGEEMLELDLPRQTGREELDEGLDVEVVFYEKRASLVRLPSGAELETDDHPRRYAPTIGYLGLFALAGGAWALRTGWRTGRRHGFWRKGRPEVSFGPAAVVGMTGMGGAMAQMGVGGARWVGVAGALVGLALGSWLAVRSRSRRAGD